MCGLLAYFSTDADRVDDDTVAAVRDAQHCMRHRGPDEKESWSDSRAVFGFNRLSFIDIWDSQTNTVFGARDPFGIKPLFTARLADGGLAFASEKKALLELLGGSKGAGDVDPASLQHYLTLQYVPEPATMHRGICRIESGTTFTVTDGELA